MNKKSVALLIVILLAIGLGIYMRWDMKRDEIRLAKMQAQLRIAENEMQEIGKVPLNTVETKLGRAEFRMLSDHEVLYTYEDGTEILLDTETMLAYIREKDGSLTPTESPIEAPQANSADPE